MKRNLNGTFAKEHLVNNKYFDKIDTELKAYILGFFYADGYNNEDNGSINFTQLELDKDILDKIKIELESDSPYIKEIQNTNNKIKYKLSIYNKHLSLKLSELGAPQNKSYIILFPTQNIIPYYLINHFIRGYFDGDGCIWEGKPHIATVKYGNSTRERFIHNMKFTFTGANKFILALLEYLIDNLGFRKTKINYSKVKDKNNIKWGTLEYSGKKLIKKLFNFMYKNATIYGNRKHQKFVNIICANTKKLVFETRLIAGKPLES